MQQQQQPMNSAPHAVPYGEKTRPAATGNRAWSFGLFDCFSPFETCMLGWCCPCILFGKTQSRQRGDPEGSLFNLMCCGYCLSAYLGAYGCLQTMTRNEMRKKFGVEGSGMGDFLTSCCCSCCALVQEEKESLLRYTEAAVGGGANNQYQAPGGMAYP